MDCLVVGNGGRARDRRPVQPLRRIVRRQTSRIWVRVGCVEAGINARIDWSRWSILLEGFLRSAFYNTAILCCVFHPLMHFEAFVFFHLFYRFSVEISIPLWKATWERKASTKWSNTAHGWIGLASSLEIRPEGSVTEFLLTFLFKRDTNNGSNTICSVKHRRDMGRWGQLGSGSTVQEKTRKDFLILLSAFQRIRLTAFGWIDQFLNRRIFEVKYVCH